MTASATSRPIPSAAGALPPGSSLDAPPDYNTLAGTRLFKKHKTLPRPSSSARQQPVPDASLPSLSLSVKYPSAADTSPPRTLRSSRALSYATTPRRQPARIGGGPDPPPTPPAAHSHVSLAAQPALLPNRQAERSQTSSPTTGPTTPTNQRTPPTPNLTPERPTPEKTPPGPAERRPKPRPPINDRMPSKSATDSRTASFKTAPEHPYSSEEDNEKSTLRALPPSTRVSDSSTVRPNSDSQPSRVPASAAKKEFPAFDGEWGSGTEVEQEWDDNLMRNVTVRKRRRDTNGTSRDVVDEATVAPSNATKALRPLSLQESPPLSSRRADSDQKQPSTAPSTSDSANMDARRSSGISTRSTVSTVVEAAVLVDAPPARRRTLRHVKKKAALRDSGLDLSLTPTSALSEESKERPRQDERRGRERAQSTVTSYSISSRKARDGVWRNGGIPVVVVPARHSSAKSSSKEPSLRSTSSRRSKRSRSVGSAPVSVLSVRGRDSVPPSSDRRRKWPDQSPAPSDASQRSRDQRTIDYPPVVPARSSSLSAPTSRNTSRAGSLTTESLEAHNALQAQQARRALQALPGRTQPTHRPTHQGPPTVMQQQQKQKQQQQQQQQQQQTKDSRLDGYDDPMARLSVPKTPFSQASVETTATSQAEVSEAQAVSIFPHQNRSVLVVNHSNKPSESSSTEPDQKPESPGPQTAAGPVTPPQLSLDDVDSPLRNPRAPPAPPEPPAIKFIPATPSGLTPAADKEEQLGNYFEDEPARKPSRSASLIRKTLSLGRGQRSEYGPSASRTHRILTRTFSLSLKRDAGRAASEREGSVRSSGSFAADGGPADEDRLHPFWRPSYSRRSTGDGSWRRASTLGDEEEETLRYPPVDNRPASRRSLSARVKRTFAILPIRDDEPDDDFYDEYEAGGTAYRTIRHTPSGNLRVVRHRPSLDSISSPQDGRPHTAPDHETLGRPHYWFRRSSSISRNSIPKIHDDDASSTRSKFFPGLGVKMEKYGLHHLPRMISERQRERRSRELRDKISKPRDVVDGVEDVVKRNHYA